MISNELLEIFNKFGIVYMDNHVKNPQETIEDDTKENISNVQGKISAS